MSKSTDANEPQARYISVADVQSLPAGSSATTSRKALLTTERLEIVQTSIRGPGPADDHAARSTDSCAYVLSGRAALKLQDAAMGAAEVGQGQLIVIPAGARWGQQLSVLSDELVLLEIARASDDAQAHAACTEPRAEVHRVDPLDVEAYQPAGHAKTTNRCLFSDEHMEVIEGLIERGGGAERHAHRDNEQMLYVLSGAPAPLLIYYPEGAPHGTGGGIAEPLKLLVIYSPPLGESHNALA